MSEVLTSLALDVTHPKRLENLLLLVQTLPQHQ